MRPRLRWNIVALVALVAMVVPLGATVFARPASASPVWGTAGAGSGGGDPFPADPALLSTVQLNGGYVAAGVGLRNLGHGTISISGIPSGSTVQDAYLLWDELAATNLNLAQGVFNGTTITGTSLGSDISPCWPAPNNYGYVADVTGEVSGNGTYSLGGFASGATDGSDPWGSSPAPEVEGASLVVVYANPSSPATTVQLYGGASEVQSGSINQSFAGFGTVASPAAAQTTFIVADGQSASDFGATFNSAALANSQFQGADPTAAGSYSLGNLWDTKTFDVSSLINAGATTASATIGSTSDCLVWVGQVLAVNSTQPGPPSSGVGVGGGDAAKHNPTCNTPRPVNCASGDFWHTFTDVTVPGRGPALQLNRTYNSLAAGTPGLFGYGWASSYDQHLAVNGDGSVTVTEADGSQVTATPSGSSYVVPGWADSTLAHNANGTWTFVRQKSEIYTFSATGQLAALADLNGETTNLSYGGGRLSTVTDSSGRTLSFGYGANGLVSTVTDPGGRITSYGYDSAGNLTAVTDPNHGITAFTYDSGHRLLTMTDPRGGVTTNVFDSQARVTSQTDPAGRTTTFAYSGSPFSANGGTTTITDPNANITVEQYRNGELTALTKGSGTSAAATWRYTYDPTTLGRTTATDPNGHLTRSAYDGSGNLLAQTGPPTAQAPTGAQTTYTYNNLDEPVTVTDPNGETTTYSYDADGNLTSISRPLSGTNQAAQTLYTHGSPSHPGDVTSLTDPDGKVWTFAYDSQGDLASSTDPLGNQTTVAYNNVGERTAAVSPKGNVSGGNPALYTTSYSYDPLGDLTQTTDPLGHITRATYDADRHPITKTDADGNTTSFSYDADNELTTTTRPDHTTLTYSYDGDGNQTGRTDGNGHTTTYGFDALNRVLSSTDPLNRKTSYTYDPAGNRLTLVDPAGQTTTWAYDAANQVTAITYSDGVTPNVSNIAYNPAGQRTAMTDGTGTSSWAYDSLGRLTSFTNGAAATVAYGYDLKGQQTSITYPGTTGTVTRGYDAAGHLSSVTDFAGHTTTYGYDPDSNNTAETFPAATNLADSFSYNTADQLTAINDTKSGSTTASFSYTRDANAQVTAVTATGVPNGNHTYTYNQLNQIAGVDTASYGYDPGDNPTQLASGAAQHFDAANQLTGTPLPSGPAPTLDQKVTKNQPSKQSTITSPALTTSAANELILAFVTADGPATTSGVQTATSVTGGGLTWSLAARENSDLGTAEIWQTYATSPLSAATITAHLQSAQDASITVAAFTGAAPTVGATAIGSDPGGAPNVGLTATTGGSLIWAAGEDYDHAATVTPTGGQTLQNSYLDTSVNTTYWTQSTPSVAAAGTTVAVADSTPSGDRWNLAAVEIRPAGTTPAPVLSLDREVNAAQTSGAATVTSPAISTSTPNELLLAYIAADDNPSNDQSITSVTGGGLTWTRAARANVELGTAEIWQAYATSALNAATVTATLADAADAAITVAAFTGANPNVGAAASGGGLTGGPAVSLTTTKAASLIWAVGEDDSSAAPHTPTSGQILTTQYLDTNHATTAWTQALPGPIPTTGTNLSVGDSDPTTDSWELAAVEITAANPDAATTTYTYNSRGDRTAATPTVGPSQTLGYDQANRLTSYTRTTTTATYTYNGDGLRMAKTVNGTTEQYTYDLTASTPLILADGTTEIIYGPGNLPIEEVTPTGTYYYHHDQQGSTRLLTDNNGNTTATYSYDPYGNLIGSTGSTNNLLGYAAAYTDPESAFLYLTNRYYDPTTAQFLTVDPVVGITQQPYSYVNDNPVNGTDRLGLAGTGCPTSDPTCTVDEGSPSAGTPPPCGGDPSLEPPCSSGTSLWTVVAIAGAAAGVVAFASGIGELAAGAYATAEGGEAIFLGISADAYGNAGLASTGIATAIDIPGCIERPGIGSCAGLALNLTALGLGVIGGTPTWANGVTLNQGLSKALAAGGGAGVTAWDVLKAWAESTLGLC